MEQQDDGQQNQPPVTINGHGQATDLNNNNINHDQVINNQAENEINQQQQQQEEQRVIPTTQDVHTREKLFDFIALLQGRRMDDQRAILKPPRTSTSS